MIKWALVVYFAVAPGVWMTGEELNYDGWHQMWFDSKEICLKYEKRFNENEHLLNKIKVFVRCIIRTQLNSST